MKRKRIVEEPKWEEEKNTKIIKHVDPFFVPWEDRLQGDDREELSRLQKQSIPSRKEAKKIRASATNLDNLTSTNKITESDLDRSINGNKNQKKSKLNTLINTKPIIEQFQEETPDQKRLRLAKEYISKVAIEEAREKHEQTTLGKLSKTSQTTNFQELIDQQSNFQQLANGIKEKIESGIGNNDDDDEEDEVDEEDEEGEEEEEGDGNGSGNDEEFDETDPHLRKALGKRLHEDAVKFYHYY